MQKTVLMTAMFFLMFTLPCAGAKGKDAAVMENEAKKIIEEYVDAYKPLTLKLRKAWFKYNSTGDKKASDEQAKAELELRTLASDANRFAKLKELRVVSKDFKDPLVGRQIEVMYLEHLPNQASKEQLKKVTDIGQRIEQTYNDYRPVVDGKKLSPVDVERILSDSTDNAELEKVWKAHYILGAKVEKDYRELVDVRNEIARNLGYKNALAMYAESAEMDLNELDKFYDDVGRWTQKPFKKLKEEYMDPRLAKRYGISAGRLMPWHYQNAYFQEAPTAIFGGVDLDVMYRKMDSSGAVQAAKNFYASMGVDVDGIIKRSSLFPKAGKNPHAFAEMLNPDTPDTSVLLMNLPTPPAPPKASQVSTLVHELGHDINYEAVASNKDIPFYLKDPGMISEAVAMLFEQQTMTEDWFSRLGVSSDDAKRTAEAVELIDYVDQLIFLRWASTIYCFERQFYANPEQDIGGLWWTCRTQNQLLARPEGWKNPDALAKYHIPNIAPLYYSNYAIGRVANVQFAELMAKRIGADFKDASYFGKKELGEWLMGDFLAQGERYRWDEFIKFYSGKPLSVKVWKERYIGSNAEKRLYQ